MNRRAVVLAILALCQTEGMATPKFVYLTWQEDPATAVTVSYHTFPFSASLETGPRNPASRVTFDRRSRAKTGEPHRFSAAGTAHQMTQLADRRWVHRVVLRNLLPDTVYFFVAGDQVCDQSEEYSFRTAPDDGRALTFVSGGDMGVGSKAKALLDQAAAQSPLFCLVGGDLAYAEAVPENYELWDRWLENWQEAMVTPDNRLVPMVLAVGNHDVDRTTEPSAPFFHRYFPQGGASYFSRRVGTNLALFVLDSGHLVPRGGAQASWLADQLEASQKVPFRFAIYHVPLYPGYRPYNESKSQLGRDHWGPLFDRFGLTAAFENHDHMLKRSKILRGGEVVADGTLYLGDGCFGRTSRITKGPRQVDRSRRWYLEKAVTGAHFWRVDIAAGHVHYRAIGVTGEVLDATTTRSR
jgi:hypothetical protein